ncbi:ImmA/IrrE family metallo-endopeptidase [Aestuariirhabdus sp. LZHN29]|uniref:ImmA/IrrE family metallo-endopeptidase n=1 Tax=Aestuariirhabdus sp. LZHN29 TaxID=3417462 RepID=UPI003CFA37AD
MATAYAHINPDILSWARQRARISIDALAKKLNISEDRLDGWESGEVSPTFKQAQSFAAKTYIPFGYLFLREPPRETLPLPDLRTVGGDIPLEPSTELLDMVQIVLRRQQWFLEYLQDQGVGENTHVGRFNAGSSVEEIVTDMRNTLNVGLYPERGSWEDYFKELVLRIEGIGVLVMRQADLGHYTRPLSVKEFRGFAIYDSIAPVVFINQADAPSARLFTLIHELSHIWIGQSGISDAAPTTQFGEEVVCNAVAAEFLVPKLEFLHFWKELEMWQDNLPLMEAQFHVSKWVIARRAQSLKKISLEQYQQYVDDLKEQYKNRERQKGGPSYYVTKKGQVSALFSKSLVSEALSGRVLLRDAGQLLNMKPSNIGKYSRTLDI